MIISHALNYFTFNLLMNNIPIFILCNDVEIQYFISCLYNTVLYSYLLVIYRIEPCSTLNYLKFNTVYKTIVYYDQCLNVFKILEKIYVINQLSIIILH